jgi:hypothetical protein
MANTIKTPRGTFTVAAEFKNSKEAKEAGYGIYFTHYDDNDKPIDIYTKHLDELHCHFAIVQH